MASIAIQTDQGLLTIRGKVYGGVLAVHKMTDHEALFTITHIPTGYAVAKNMDKAKAEFYASRISILPVWDFKRPSRALRVADKVKAAWKICNADWQKLQSAKVRA